MIVYLSGGGRVLGDVDRYRKIEVENGTFRVASASVARAYYMNTGVISDALQVQVITGRNHRLGEVEEDFLTSR